MNVESVAEKNISYLHARDPSILAWNQHGKHNIRINLAEKWSNDTGKSSQSQEQQDHLQVFLRIKDGVRLEELYEISGENLICKIPEGSHALRNVKEGDRMTKTYTFTKIFGFETTQITIFNNVVKSRLLQFINGSNCTLLTYGASGSGKTFTIVGTPEEPGIIPRALEYVFRTIPKLKETPKVMPLPNGDVKYLDQKSSAIEKLQKATILNTTSVDRSIHIKTYKQMQQRLSSESVAKIDDLSNVSVNVWVSFAEIYNENIYDLLQAPPPRGKQRPKLHLGNSKDRCYIKDLTNISVSSGIEAYQILQYGLHNLNYAATSINSHSSRSHSIFTIKLVQVSEMDGGVCISTFNFCDLAGSERQKKTMNVGDRLTESKNINTSLLVLGRCMKNIRSAQQLKDNRLVPFRESKLTQLFQRALTGSEDIMMIVNMNASRDMFDETQHVLDFSAVAKDILVEEQHKIIRPKKVNRFSQYMEKKTTSIPSIKEEDERDMEINRLKTVITELYMELEQKKQQYEEELKSERDYIRTQYNNFIEGMRERLDAQKTRAVNKVKKEYEEKIQILTKQYSILLKDQSNVITIDTSSESDSEGVSSKQRIDKTNLVEQELCEIKIENERLTKEIQIIPKLEEQIKILKESDAELRITLHEAEVAYTDLQSQVQDLEVKNKKLISENLQLQEELECLEALIPHQVDDDADAQNDDDEHNEKFQPEEVEHL